MFKAMFQVALYTAAGTTDSVVLFGAGSCLEVAVCAVLTCDKVKDINLKTANFDTKASMWFIVTEFPIPMREAAVIADAPAIGKLFVVYG